MESDFEKYKSSSLLVVVNTISDIRSLLVTDLPGQQMIYLAKEAEAHRFMANPTTDMTTYPLLLAEVGVTAADATSLATMWITLSAQWRGAAAYLERTRMVTSAAIGAAQDRETVEAAVDAAMTELNFFRASISS